MKSSAKQNAHGEWIYPQMYYRNGKRTTKQAILEEIEQDPLIQEVLHREPEVRLLFEQAEKERCVYGYDANEVFYTQYKPHITRLVGWRSPHEALKTTQHYEAIYDAIYALLPADEVDLYPDGIMPNGMHSPNHQEKHGR